MPDHTSLFKFILGIASIWSISILLTEPYRQKFWDVTYWMGINWGPGITQNIFNIAFRLASPYLAYYFWLTRGGRYFRREENIGKIAERWIDEAGGRNR
jgi:hypothetical protein